VVLAIAIAAVTTLLLSETQASGTQGKVSSQVMVATANGESAPFVIYMGAQADLSDAYAITDQDLRGRYVYDKLRQQAERTQGPVKELLDARGVTYKSFWVANVIMAEGNRSDVEALADRSDVAAIESDTALNWVQGEEEVESTDEGNAVDAIETGLTNAKAPSLWSLGFKGAGQVVANQDTGMLWTHNALRTHYRGWGGSVATSDHNYNWWDSVHQRITSSDGGTASPATNSCGYNLQAPCDDQGHGTHTTGTIVGDDGATNQIGMAPDAKWIGCRNMDAGNGRAYTYAECFQFFLAPTDLTGHNPRPDLRPDVMNNSWGCPAVGELCAANTLKAIVDSLDASGVFVEVSAGNDGPSCSTVQDPPAIYSSAFATGAISGSTNALQSFSSRGPVNVDGSGRMKPNIVAPGASVRSSLRNAAGTSYGTMSGTSMAGPHVVGAVALLWSARPHLVRDVARTKRLLEKTANRVGITVANNSTGCGGIVPTPNNHFGYGRLDVLAAYNAEPGLNQTIDFPQPAAKTYGDADFPVTATASSDLPVTLSVVGSCTISGTTVRITGAGSCAIPAAQAGDIDHYPAELTRTVAIAKADQTITFAQPDDKTWGDADFALTATASSGLPVSFSTTGTCTVSGATAHITSAGSCAITASQAGDDNRNAAADVTRTVLIAKADQSITFDAIDDRVWGDPDFDISPSASSGLPVSLAATGSCTVSGQTIHIVTVNTCTVTASQAGNVNYNPASKSRTFRVAWAFTGFFAPVDIRPLINVAQAGSAIPVKFSLGGDQGMNIFAAGSPFSTSTACDTGAPSEAVGETVTPGSSSLSFSSGRYHYVWKTEKAWAGTCRQLSVKLADGTVHTADFQFKK
jgi:subtilisin family serine protease